MGELYQYVVTSDSLSLTELKTLHDYTIRPRLRTRAGRVGSQLVGRSDRAR